MNLIKNKPSNPKGFPEKAATGKTYVDLGTGIPYVFDGKEWLPVGPAVKKKRQLQDAIDNYDRAMGGI